ncbi:hypothetical protein EYF80_021407 [Liparis tanakae]|uniref:Uncharacterized protein n=1 Tax=Liparis tanakae TaxID=230148 RepID=A0A4Z2HTP4_9TELE|nr:hypothetical protein EYF80_021407 [Liparis tanakae]
MTVMPLKKGSSSGVAVFSSSAHFPVFYCCLTPSVHTEGMDRKEEEEEEGGGRETRYWFCWFN